jgi:hypothetical protein
MSSICCLLEVRSLSFAFQTSEVRERSSGGMCAY